MNIPIVPHQISAECPNSLEPWPAVPPGQDLFVPIPRGQGGGYGGFLGLFLVQPFGTERTRRYTAIAIEEGSKYIGNVLDFRRTTFSSHKDEIVVVTILEFPGPDVLPPVRIDEMVGLQELHGLVLRHPPALLQGIFYVRDTSLQRLDAPAGLIIEVADRPPTIPSSLRERPSERHFDVSDQGYVKGYKLEFRSPESPFPYRVGDGWDVKHCAMILTRALNDLEKAKQMGERDAKDLQYFSPAWDLEWNWGVYATTRGSIEVQIAAMRLLYTFITRYGVDNSEYRVSALNRRLIGRGGFVFRLPVEMGQNVTSGPDEAEPREGGLPTSNDRTTF